MTCNVGAWVALKDIALMKLEDDVRQSAEGPPDAEKEPKFEEGNAIKHAACVAS